DHMDQPTFHALYEQADPKCKAELVEGIVMIPFSVSVDHASDHNLVMTWLGVYRAATPGVQALDNATIVLGPKSEPQPDGALLIRAEFGGQTRVEGKNVVGAPELVVEVA